MRETKFGFAERVNRIPSYIFAELEKVILEKKRQGIRIISLSIGDPDLPPPRFVLNAFLEEAGNPKNHNYSFSQGEPEFREAVALWYKHRFDVELDPRKEVIGLIGSKEGLANIARAFTNPNDKILVPDPAYPVYTNGSAILCDSTPVPMPLLEENAFKPDLDAIGDIKAKMMFLNYPNNPTGAVAEKPFLKEVVEYAEDHSLILCYDNAYSEIAFDDYESPSILQIDGAMDTAIEFHSCSKTFNMTGDRIGFAVGNRRLIEGLTRVKTQIDSGPPVYVQRVAARALESYAEGKTPSFLKENLKIYRERRDALVQGLKSADLACNRPKATFYVWLNCKEKSMKFATKLLDVGVVVTPGASLGEYGEGYVRLALTRPKEEIEEACRRISKVI